MTGRPGWFRTLNNAVNEKKLKVIQRKIVVQPTKAYIKFINENIL